jgi:uncharacterized protein YfaT (DUF1175 family)
MLSIQYSGWGETHAPRDCAGLVRVFGNSGLDRFFNEALRTGNGESKIQGSFASLRMTALKQTTTEVRNKIGDKTNNYRGRNKTTEAGTKLRRQEQTTA